MNLALVKVTQTQLFQNSISVLAVPSLPAVLISFTAMGCGVVNASMR